MKLNSKPFDATLHQLGGFSTASHPEPPASRNRPYSFEIRKAAQKGNVEPLNQAPTLPKFNPSFISHRYSATPALETNLLPEIQTTDPGACRTELQQVVREIQDIYLEGPIIDGWLESYPSEDPSETVARQIEYVEVSNPEHKKITREASRPGYRLCGLDADGNIWSRPCSSQHLPSVSIAIARYQKLQHLLERKQYIENCLSEIGQDSIILD